MFTGIIQTVGRIYLRDQLLAVEGTSSINPLELGDSVAVDGVCLTVSALIKGGFLANLSEETLSRTTLGEKARRGTFVNLEPALKLSDRLGGHLVSGHVDACGEIISIEKLSNSWEIQIQCKEKSVSNYICKKGSISIDGISLTISECAEDGTRFTVAVIPHTWDNTSLKFINETEIVNLESDLLAKYAEKLLKRNFLAENSDLKSGEKLSKAWLEKHGW